MENICLPIIKCGKKMHVSCVGVSTCSKVPYSQFHQRFTRKFFCTNVISAAFSSYVLALVRNLYEKFARKMLMKLTPESYFSIIILHNSTHRGSQPVNLIDVYRWCASTFSKRFCTFQV